MVRTPATPTPSTPVEPATAADADDSEVIDLDRAPSRYEISGLASAESRLGALIEQAEAAELEPEPEPEPEPIELDVVESESNQSQSLRPRLSWRKWHRPSPLSSEPEPAQIHHPVIEPVKTARSHAIIAEPIAMAGQARRSTATVVTIILTAIVFTGVGLVLGTRSGQPTRTSPTAPPLTSVTTAPVDDTASAPSASTSGSEPGPIAAPSGSVSPAAGNVVSRLSGSANRQSALFQLPDGAVQIRYNTTGGNLTVRLSLSLAKTPATTSSAQALATAKPT